MLVLLSLEIQAPSTLQQPGRVRAMMTRQNCTKTAFPGRQTGEHKATLRKLVLVVIRVRCHNLFSIGKGKIGGMIGLIMHQTILIL
jgi:hypothetical protein